MIIKKDIRSEAHGRQTPKKTFCFRVVLKFQVSLQ